MNDQNRPEQVGRGSQINPPNRFARIEYVEDLSDFDTAEDEPHRIQTEYYEDLSKSVVTENNSPDVFFRYSLNPYRGCAHGCSYCYARPSHEYLGMSAGLDFETRIFVKPSAPDLFREWLGSKNYQPEPVMMSGVTDCYQPAERQFQLTRACLKVALECRQPMLLITKNALVLRDLDLLSDMAKQNLVGVALSITSLDQSLTRKLEPRTSAPAARLRAIRELSAAGIPTRVMVAPVIPGLNDSEIPAILKAAKDEGASSAGYVLLRLPMTVKPVFLDWLEHSIPQQKEKILTRIRSTRDGQLNDAHFGSRMRGSGEHADQIRQTFDLFARKYELNAEQQPLDTTQFIPPRPTSGQLSLF